MKKLILTLALGLRALDTFGLTTFTYEFDNADGTANTNAVTMVGWPPANNSVVVYGGKIVNANLPIFLQPDASGQGTGVAMPNYYRVTETFDSGSVNFFVNIPDTTNVFPLAAYVTNAPVIFTPASTFAFLTNQLGGQQGLFQAMLYTPATNSAAGIAAAQGYQSATNSPAGIIAALTYVPLTNTYGAVTNTLGYAPVPPTVAALTNIFGYRPATNSYGGLIAVLNFQPMTNNFSAITNVLGYQPLANNFAAVTNVLGYQPLPNTFAAVTNALGYQPLTNNLAAITNTLAYKPLASTFTALTNALGYVPATNYGYPQFTGIIGYTNSSGTASRLYITNSLIVTNTTP